MKDLFNNLSDENKEIIKNLYNLNLNNFKNSTNTEVISNALNVCTAFFNIFGSDEFDGVPTIDSWNDIERIENIKNLSLTSNNYAFSNFLSKKAINYFKIILLIENGYGGIISNEEWKDSSIQKFTIVPVIDKDITYNIVNNAYPKHPLSFRSQDDAKRFFDNNEELVKNYYE